MIRLSILVPTRNRQAYCIETLKALAASSRDDFEVITGDNSDDPGPLRGFFDKTLKEDSRFRLIAPDDHVLAMSDNWERLVPEAKGRWLVMIGDDDYVDPDLAAVLRRYETLYPDADSVSWPRLGFAWPDNRLIPTLASVPVTHGDFIIPRKDAADRLYRWSEGKRRPASGFGIYHGAIKRSLMERIKRKYGGRYFEHPNVDWENTCKVLREARQLVHNLRGFSVLGACGASNSAGVQSAQVLLQRAQTFRKETEGKVNMDDPVFPFPISDPGASVCASVASTTYWFCRTYGEDMTGFPENFAKAAADELLQTPTEEAYTLKRAYFQRGFETWEGGRWKEAFKPLPFQGERNYNALTGVVRDTLYIREKTIPAATPGEFYAFASHAMMPVRHIAAGTKVFAR